MVVVDDLDEWLHLAALALAGLGHAAGDLQWVALDTGDERVWEGMGLAAVVLWLDDDDLLACIAAAGDDGLLHVLLDGGGGWWVLGGVFVPLGQP